jgi:hypothetical protein
VGRAEARGHIEDIAKKLQEANPALSDAQAFEKAFLVVVHQQVVAAVRDGLLQVADDVRERVAAQSRQEVSKVGHR